MRICHRWEQAVAAAGLASARTGALADFQPLLAYQNGDLALGPYLAELAHWLGFPDAGHALAVHNHILIEEYPGVAALAADLRSAGWTLGCLSNTNEAHWDEMLRSGRFPTVAGLQVKVASHELGLSKPDPAIYAAFLAAAPCRREDVVYFDDHPENVAAARALGWQAHLIDPAADPAAQMRTALSAPRTGAS
ncbi:MAG: HAD-IA family hydrolase [Fimbriimonadaceae bacterium]|nr:HAD-IA family hydrolase [Fimbriimonadaceae bacterium]